LVSRRERKKTKRRVALLQQPRVFKSTVAPRQFGLATVFRNYENVGRESPAATCATEEVERAGVLCFGLIGRIDVDEIDKLRDFAEPLQHRSHAPVLHGEPSINLQRRKILADSCQRRLCVFGKPNMGRTTAQRLDSNRLGAGVEVDKATAAHARRENIEESFAQAVAGRPGLKTTWGNELTRAIGSCNDAHLWMV